MISLKSSTLLIISFHIFASLCPAQEKFDVISFTAPGGWQKQSNQNAVIYSTENKSTGAFCAITIFKSLAAGSDSKKNFNAAWETFVKENLSVSAAPQMQPAASENGWTIESGFAVYDSNGAKAMAMLVALNGNKKLLPILVLANSDAYQSQVTSFLETIVLPNAATDQSQNDSSAQPRVNSSPSNQSLPAAKNSGFKFNTTNFDDGWTAIEQEDWVRVSNSTLTVLLHYPRPEDKEQIYEQLPRTKRFWDLLVAPRYSNLRNFEILKNNLAYEPGNFAAGDVIDNQTGKNVYVVLFSKGKSGWMEFIAPDRSAFVSYFKINHPDLYFSDWEPLAKMATYNSFAVSAADLPGKWTSDFGSMMSYYNAYSGAHVATATYSSVQNFDFGANQNYAWKLLVASGSVGNMNFQKAASTGKFSVPDNWHIQFSDIEGKPKTYAARFSCIKGGRILWIDNAAYGKVNQ